MDWEFEYENFTDWETRRLRYTMEDKGEMDVDLCELRDSMEANLPSEIEKHPNLDYVLKAIGNVHPGGIWLVGSFLIDLGMKLAHNHESGNFRDFDIMIDESTLTYNPAIRRYEVIQSDTSPLYHIPLLKQISKTKSRLGAVKFNLEGIEFDIWDLTNLYLTHKKEQPSLTDYLDTTPFNVQSIAYSYTSNRIIGDVGLRGILQKRVMANDLDTLKRTAERNGMTMKDVIEEKADQFGLTPVFMSLPQPQLALDLN